MDDKWSEVFVNGEYKPLTRLEVFDYYSNPHISKKLIEEIKNNPVVLVQKYGDKFVIKRNESKNGKKIEIKKSLGKLKNSLGYWTKRRTVEVHKTISKKTKEAIIDIDPENVPMQVTKDIVHDIVKIFKNDKLFGSGPVDIIYSGGRGFYIRKKIKNTDVTEARNTLKKEVIAPLLKTYKDLVVNKKPKSGEIRLDLSPMKRGGSYRAPFSINAATGLTAMPLSEREFSVFEPHMALPSKVIHKQHAIKNWRP